MKKWLYNLALTFVVWMTAPISAQQNSSINFNELYRFPLSVGVDYIGLQALSGFPSDFVFRSLGSELRVPIPFNPVVQTLFGVSQISVTQNGSTGTGFWDHSVWSGLAGFLLITRFSKNFELGTGAAAGFGYTYFQNLDPAGVVGSPLIFAQGELRISLIPSYNYSVDLRPTIRYSQSLGPLTEFNGFSVGFGFGVAYRFGQDPDSTAASVRAFRIGSGKMPNLFAAMQSYYANQPFGIIELVNEDRLELQNVEVSFFQSGFMDAPTPLAMIDRVPGKSAVFINLIASFNQEIFKTEGITPLTGELLVSYRYKGRAVEQRFPLAYELYDKTSIIWDDDRKVGAFITPSDSALRNYLSFVRQSLKSEAIAQFNENLQTAAQIYAALVKLGLIYQSDPISPFVKAQEKQSVLDSVSLGRDTLRRGTGDCDDLTVLYASLLESAGIETGFITVPGHIYAIFNTKVKSRDYRELHPDRSMFLTVSDTLWIPVEVTLIGKQSFYDAWIKGAELWNLYEKDQNKRAFYRTADAQKLFRPVALRESDLGLQYGSQESLAALYKTEISRVADGILQPLADLANKSNNKQDWTYLGVAYAKFGRLKEAETAFNRVMKIDPNSVSVQVNLGNIAYLQRDYRKAVIQYQGAYNSLVKQGKQDSLTAQKVLISLSKTYTGMKDFAQAKQAFEKASAIDSSQVREFAYLAQVGAGQDTIRGDSQADTVLFIIED
ncbi:hypothetical protein [Gracilinema caldarium]|uniref:tetratricopeptide repeat protein n=1 Tax=Gracilinema caldarium TaxID=215591 RepID=UPI0026EE6B3C|nr:hypothetical protein [Gracilinema caldarium]